MADRRPNILFVLSDQERSWSWLPSSVRLPWRERLRAEGLTLANHWTHSSPCSPSRTTIQTGLHVPQHGVTDNTIFPWHHSLDTSVPTVGSVLRHAGYRSSYIGKWHVSYGPTPQMEAYGYSDWDGNDQHYMGWAGTGVAFDPEIADNAAHWLRTNATTLDQPWFLTVALVNPHDVDLQEDPHELVNLAHDRGRRAELRRRFEDLLALEAAELGTLGADQRVA